MAEMNTTHQEAPGGVPTPSPFPPAETRAPAAVRRAGNGRATSGGERCPKCGAAVTKEMKECPACRTLLFFSADSMEQRLERIRGFSLGQLLFREREYLFELIFKEERLDAKLRYYVASAWLFAALYGALLGTKGGWLQIPTGAAKMPILLFGTLVICAPALFTFNVLLGSKLTARQTVAVLVTATYLMSAVLASLAPIVFFFILSGSARDFVVLLNVIACAIAGGFAVALVWQGMKYLTIRSGGDPNLGILKVWMLIYMFVGTQLAWTLRPFVGTAGQFALFRHLEGDFYSAVAQLIARMVMWRMVM
ncbi:MAG: actin-binding WH2 domain-containing protein [Armatimonadetes bacterium]|nr:actin-binding WH2 domain-containing protein [Armatimonadota bacterium]